MKEPLTNDQAYYLGRAVSCVIATLHPQVNTSLYWGEIYSILIKAEEDYRNSDANHHVFEELYLDHKPARWVRYFEGVKKGIIEVMRARGVREDGSHIRRTKNSKKLSSLLGSVTAFLKGQEQEKFFIHYNNEANTEKAKIYITNLSVVYKMQKIRNGTYMKSLAEEIGRKLAKNSKLIGIIGSVLSEFGGFIANFGLKLSGVIEVPEEIIGLISSSEDIEEEDASESNFDRLRLDNAQVKNEEEKEKIVIKMENFIKTGEQKKRVEVESVEEEEEEEDDYYDGEE